MFGPTPNRRILVCDDNTAIHEDFRKILLPKSKDVDFDDDEALLFGQNTTSVVDIDFEVDFASQGQDGVKLVADSLRKDTPYAVAFVDIRMPPGWDGVQTIENLWKVDPRVQIVICTAHSDYSSDEILERLGVSDQLVIIKKPFDQEEVRLLATALSHKWQLTRQVEMRQEELEDVIQARTREIEATRDVAMFTLARLTESRDVETGNHVERMREYAQAIGRELGRSGPYTEQVTSDFLKQLFFSTPLHDIGKVGIPDDILLKPGKLTNEEFDIMKTHTTIGADTLRDAALRSDSGSFLDMAATIARYHHEKFNGRGYPEGLAGQNIPLAARIAAVADVFDALTSDRVYKRAMPIEQALDIIESERDQHFDAHVVDAFVRRLDEVRKIHARLHAEDPPFEDPSEANTEAELVGASS